jgi:hypothetical protein
LDTFFLKKEKYRRLLKQCEFEPADITWYTKRTSES